MGINRKAEVREKSILAFRGSEWECPGAGAVTMNPSGSSQCGRATFLRQLPFWASFELRAGVRGFLGETSEQSQLIITVEFFSDGERPPIHEKENLSRRHSNSYLLLCLRNGAAEDSLSC